MFVGVTVSNWKLEKMKNSDREISMNDKLVNVTKVPSRRQLSCQAWLISSGMMTCSFPTLFWYEETPVGTG